MLTQDIEGRVNLLANCLVLHVNIDFHEDVVFRLRIACRIEALHTQGDDPCDRLKGIHETAATRLLQTVVFSKFFNNTNFLRINLRKTEIKNYVIVTRNFQKLKLTEVEIVEKQRHCDILNLPKPYQRIYALGYLGWDCEASSRINQI